MKSLGNILNKDSFKAFLLIPRLISRLLTNTVKENLYTIFIFVYFIAGFLVLFFYFDLVSIAVFWLYLLGLIFLVKIWEK